LSKGFVLAGPGPFDPYISLRSSSRVLERLGGVPVVDCVLSSPNKGGVAQVDEGIWRRVGAWCGIGYIVLSILSTFLYPQAPRVDSNPAVVLKWAQGHRVGLEAGMAIGIFAALLFLWFVAYLRHRVDPGGGDPLGSVLYGSGVAFVAISVLGGIPYAALVFMAGQPGGVSDGALVRLLNDLGQMLFAPTAGLTAVFLLATGIVIVHSRVFSPTLGWAAIGVSVLNAIEVVTALTFSSYHAGGWTAVAWVSFLGFLAIVLATSIALLRPARAATDLPTERVLTT
jgi:hypothetical protein